MSTPSTSNTPFRLRSLLRGHDLPPLLHKLTRALSDTTPTEMKVSYHGDMQIVWTEYAPDPDTARRQGLTRLTEGLPKSYDARVDAEVIA